MRGRSGSGCGLTERMPGEEREGSEVRWGGARGRETGRKESDRMTHGFLWHLPFPHPFSPKSLSPNPASGRRPPTYLSPGCPASPARSSRSRFSSVWHFRKRPSAWRPQRPGVTKRECEELSPEPWASVARKDRSHPGVGVGTAAAAGRATSAARTSILSPHAVELAVDLVGRKSERTYLDLGKGLVREGKKAFCLYWT